MNSISACIGPASLLCLLLCGCQKPPAAAPSQAVPAPAGAARAKAPSAEGVVLASAEAAKIGLATEAARAAEYREQTAGYGIVVPHETLGQAAAELTIAQAADRQSSAALARQKQLSGTAGAVSSELEDAAVHQAAVDRATLALARQRLSATFGSKPPWSGDERVLQDLASGRSKLLRATFPLGALSGAPASLRAAHLADARPGAGVTTHTVWEAPADANVPGRSFFALLKEGDFAEGERLQVWAPAGAAASGVLVPDAAVVMSAGRYWCYLERSPGTYVRTEISLARPAAGGYFVADSIRPGDKVVTAAAAWLLAAESNPEAEPP